MVVASGWPTGDKSIDGEVGWIVVDVADVDDEPGVSGKRTRMMEISGDQRQRTRSELFGVELVDDEDLASVVAQFEYLFSKRQTDRQTGYIADQITLPMRTITWAETKINKRNKSTRSPP